MCQMLCGRQDQARVSVTFEAEPCRAGHKLARTLGPTPPTTATSPSYSKPRRHLSIWPKTRQNIAFTMDLKYTNPSRRIVRRNSSAPTLTLHTGTQTVTLTDDTTSGSGSGSEAKNTSKHKHKSSHNGRQREERCREQ